MRACACHLQFTRTIQNYQKAYRKKVEGLKTELKTSRNTNARLTKQVKRLKSVFRVHLPSIGVGLLLGAVATSVWRRIRAAKKASNDDDEAAAEVTDRAPVAES